MSFRTVFKNLHFHLFGSIGHLLCRSGVFVLFFFVKGSGSGVLFLDDLVDGRQLCIGS